MVEPVTPIAPLITGAAADVQLDSITGVTGSRSTVFVPTLSAAQHGFNIPGPLATPSARGSRAWLDGHEELRVRLTEHGWKVPTNAALDSSGVVISRDGRTGITLVAGDQRTGREGLAPQVKYKRGPVATEFVQGSLFDGFAETANNPEWWYLLHEITSNGWSAELALPADIRSGWISRWKFRIQIIADGLDGRPASEADNTPELPMPTVRWRDSA